MSEEGSRSGLRWVAPFASFSFSTKLEQDISSLQKMKRTHEELTANVASIDKVTKKARALLFVTPHLSLSLALILFF
jgi:uncharacterized protein YecE (DUF72 family)